jgi:hypothetical protein
MEMSDPITIDEVMEQAQVFASAYALVGSNFDDGSKFRQSQVEKEALEVMVRTIVDEAILGERKRCADIAENIARYRPRHCCEFTAEDVWLKIKGEV